MEAPSLSSYRQSECGMIQPSEVAPFDVEDSIDFYGRCMPQNGSLGGDRLDVLDYGRLFSHERLIKNARENGRGRLAQSLERNRHLLGVILTDTSGHGLLSDVIIPTEIHAAAYNGIGYEVPRKGHVTAHLFESISHAHFGKYPSKLTTLLYGEVSKRDGTGKFISAGHPFPLIVRASGELDRETPKNWVADYPLGVLPSATAVYRPVRGYEGALQGAYKVNHFKLDRGDSILFFTDWLMEHGNSVGKHKSYTAQPRFFETLRTLSTGSAKEMVLELIEDALGYSFLLDDLSLVAFKRV